MIGYASASTSAPDGWNVYGKVTVDGVLESHVPLKFTCGDESIIKETGHGATGEFSFDTSEFKTCPSMSVLTLAYCYNTWQCEEVKETFTYVGGGRGKDMSRDFPGMLASYPLFIVIGQVTKEGFPVTGEVKVENLRTGVYKMITIDTFNAGQYETNLADFKYGWLDKDWIQVCYSGKCKVFQALTSMPGMTIDLELTDESLQSPETPYYHGKRKVNYVPTPEEPEEEGEEELPEEGEEGEEEPEETPEEGEEIILPKNAKIGVWMIIIIIIVVLGVGYYFITRKDL